MIPVSSTTIFDTLGSAVSSFGKKFDVPTGAYLRRIGIITQDETAAGSGGGQLSDDIVDAVALELPKESRRLIEINWDAIWSIEGIPAVPLQTAAGAVTKPIDAGAVTGFGVIDLRPFADPDNGLDLRGYGTGDVKLSFTIPSGTTGDDIIIWYDLVQPYKM
jgi:hypothetical protein